jgi:hypothetical protein
MEKRVKKGHPSFLKQNRHSKSLNDLYGKNIWNNIEPEKDMNYWNFFGVSNLCGCLDKRHEQLVLTKY